jgi:hypothetical protein
MIHAGIVGANIYSKDSPGKTCLGLRERNGPVFMKNLSVRVLI